LAEGESGPRDSFVLLLPILEADDPHLPDQKVIENMAGQMCAEGRRQLERWC
jgi:hypothetical protein